MIISQRRLSNKTRFEFGDETLRYKVEDRNGASELSLYYADFPQNSSIREVRSGWLRDAGIVAVAIGIYQMAIQIFTHGSLPDNGFWLAVGLSCLAIYKIAATTYSVFAVENDTLYVIRDAKHDEIIDAIYERRRQQLLSWYGDIDPENELDEEIAKFKWLQQQNVLSKEEAENKIAQAELLYRYRHGQIDRRHIH